MRNEELGKTRNNGKSCAFVPRDRKEITSTRTANLFDRRMGKRKRRQRAEEKGEDETEKPVLPQVHPTFLPRLAADPVQETSLQAARPCKSIFRPRLGLSNSVHGH